MPRFAVLLRGVNVGKGNRLPMADFRAALESLGYTGVRTLLNSGNAVFSGPGRSPAAHAQAIRDALRSRCGLEPPVIVKSARQLAAIAEENVLAAVAKDHSRLLVVFTQDDDALRPLEDLASGVEPPERFVVGEHAAFLYAPDGILQSTAGAVLLGKGGRAVTTRNWRTVLKLQRLLSAE
jgi:uncharacterized protein (DUF1697 family)